MTTDLTTDLKAVFEDIQSLIAQGKIMDIFEKYYADNVVMQENTNPPTIGKDANRERELDFFKKLVEFRKAELKGVAFGDNLIISEWDMDYTHSEWGSLTYTQVAVQRWQDGKVVHERFYYSN
ncbi:MAG: SnoaL-like domain-containing protein [Oculatellaceae cyanobacterium bins.114]|nr:SnoaL-like domain-containing protein [Oculatellaceae cyanobacterium bins.114]